MTQYCKVGFHAGVGGNRTDIGKYFQRLDAAGIPFSIKSNHDIGLAIEAARYAQASGVRHNILLRFSEMYPGGNDEPNFALSPMDAADEYWARTKELIEADPSFEAVKEHVWIEMVNEVVYTDEPGHNPSWMGEFGYWLANKVIRDGYNAALFGMNAGTPEAGEWETPGMLDLLVFCAEYPDRLAISLHEGKLGGSMTDLVETFVPHIVGRLQSPEWGIFAACDRHSIAHPTLFISEWAWKYNDMPHVYLAMDDVRWMAEFYARFPSVRGVFLWNLGGGAQWGDLPNKLQRLIVPITDFTLQTEYPDPPPNGPPPDECRGAPREQYSRVYNVIPPSVTDARATEIFLAGWRLSKQTAGGSYDDAGVGDLDSREAVLHDIPPDQQEVFTDWYEQHYPGVQVTFPNEDETFHLEWPTDYRVVTQRFGANPEIYGTWGLPGHEGIDIRAPMGSPIYACADGQVYRVHNNPDDHNYGIHVRVDHGNGYKTIYAHLDWVNVMVGSNVTEGEIVGWADNTGNSTGSHLHLTLKKEGATASGETNYPFDIIDPTPFLDMTGVTFLNDESDADPADPCLVGVHWRADGPGYQPDLNAINIARVEAVKLLTTAAAADPDQIRAVTSPDVFLMARIFQSGWDFRHITPHDFVQWNQPDVQKLYDAGVRHFEVHNEPNLYQEGLSHSWNDGTEFGQWFMQVRTLLKVPFPDAQFGFPGLSPGGDMAGVREDAHRFLAEASAGIWAADFLCCHCYWQDRVQMLSDVDGMGWKHYWQNYPSKPLYITEFSNNLSTASPTIKGEQYAEYYGLLRDKPVKAAFCFVVSGSGWAHEAWRREDGSTTEIPGIVGAR